MLRLQQALDNDRPSDIDELYDTFCREVKLEMDLKLPSRVISHSGGQRKRQKKEYWNDDIEQLYRRFREADKKLGRCQRDQRNEWKKLRNKERKALDREIQRAKRRHWKIMQDKIVNLEAENSKSFWRFVGSIGVASERKISIPWEVMLENGTVNSDHETVLNKWKTDFAALLNRTAADHSNETAETVENVSSHNEDEEVILNKPIDRGEVTKALKRAKNGKAHGFDAIPVEVVRNDKAIDFLTVLFNRCFQEGKVPAIWNKGVINPIPKDHSKDNRDPLNYRGITLASSVYKLYCSVLNQRITDWAEKNKKFYDAQNGFRKDRSCQDHLSTVTSLVHTRKLKRQQTFIAFIDFSKAYDGINRSKLFQVLQAQGLKGKILRSLQSLYHNYECCVRVNGVHSEWFTVQSGLKQGCILSPTLFNFYVNGLVEELEKCGKGVKINQEKVSCLLYADDLALMAENEQDLQGLLDALSKWAADWDMVINNDKSKIVHFRHGPSKLRTRSQFTLSGQSIGITEQYRYLGLIMTEYLDFNVMAKYVSMAAHRALGIIIAKCKAHGGFPYNIYTKLYYCLVQPILDYGAAVWGFKDYPCIKTVQNRAARYFLGVGKYTPIAGLQGDIGWAFPEEMQWMAVVRQWCRFSTMVASRVNKKIFTYALLASEKTKNSLFYIKSFLSTCGLDHLCDPGQEVVFGRHKALIKKKLHEHYVQKWSLSVNRVEAIRGEGQNKLRTYRKFKFEFKVENYVHLRSVKLRSALAKFRMGVAPLRIETGRYVRERPEQRLCVFCDAMEIEDEEHVLTRCKLYEDIRENLFTNMNEYCRNFYEYCDTDKMSFILSYPHSCLIVAKACQEMLKRRCDILYNF